MIAMAFLIVLGYDGSSCADEALLEAAELARLANGTVVAVYGYEPKFRVGGEMADQRHAIEQIGREYVASAARRLAEMGVEAEPVVVADRPAEALAQIAGERNAKMIVVGCRGESLVRRLAMGSVTRRLLDISPVPVLVLRSKACSTAVSGTEQAHAAVG